MFGSFRNYLAPIGRQALSDEKKLASNKTVSKIAQKAAETGAEVLTGVAVDALKGRNVGESFRERRPETLVKKLTDGPAAPALKSREKRLR